MVPDNCGMVPAKVASTRYLDTLTASPTGVTHASSSSPRGTSLHAAVDWLPNGAFRLAYPARARRVTRDGVLGRDETASLSQPADMPAPGSHSVPDVRLRAIDGRPTFPHRSSLRC